MTRFIAMLIALAVIVAGVFEWEAADFRAPGPAAKETVVLIAPHSGVSKIAYTLEEARVVKHALLFEIGVRLRGQGTALKAGEYAIPAKASLKDIADILISGKVVQHKLTAAEGLTSKMIYDIVKNDKALQGDAGAVPAEGTLLPETYLFAHGTTRTDIFTRMKAAQTALLDKLWPKRAADLPFTTREEAIILASIVEKETAIPSERRRIASVFVNRLKVGMPLQSDPTIVYGITKGYPLGRAILESEIRAATPFNTYVIAGLPPQPICNPGADSIAAVLNPDRTRYFYFVADGTGGHAFSATMEEHEKNVAKWRKIHDRKSGQ
jgi:UPF0755 protein